MKKVHGALLLFLVAWLASGFLCLAQIGGGGSKSFGAGESVVQMSSYWSENGAKPGSPITLAIVLDIRKPYHINSDRPKEGFIATTVELVDLPTDVRASTPVFPEPQELEFGPDKEKIRVFSERAIIYIPMSVTGAAKPGERAMEVKVGYQACDDKACLFPKEITQKTKLTVLEPGVSVQKINKEIFAAMKERKVEFSFFGWDFKVEQTKVGLLLFLACFGGFLLNFTPCVLPLIPIKIMGLSQAAGNRRRCLVLGASLSAGVVFFWLALAVAISSISGFDAANKLFQYPAFTISVGVIIWIMAVGMCGLFAITLPQWVYRVNPSQESTGGSFVFGIMTAVLSTPCTAPFMGAAAAWAATQSPVITLSTFAAIGVGMALPYFVLSAFPGMVHRMPRTGPASELIKQVMGLLMLAAGSYFLGTGFAGLIAKPPDPPTDAYWWLAAFFVAAAGVWLAWRTFQITPRFGRRVFFGGLGIALVFAAAWVGTQFTKGSPIKWVYYTPERLTNAQKQSKVIVLEFTAAWCLNCHLLEKAVLHNPTVVSLLNSEMVTPIKVDLTGNNHAGDEKLVEVGRRTIPYLIIYSPSGRPIFSSDAYTVEQLANAIKEAARL